MSVTVVTSPHHRLQEGNLVEIVSEGRWPRLRMLFTRPRVRYVAHATRDTFHLADRRMTWAEWRSAVLRGFR